MACKKALYERIVTVSGGGIKKPVNLKARVGTPVSMLIEEAGGTVDETIKLVAGGPMMGFAFFDPETPVTKGTSGILALTEKELRRSRETRLYFLRPLCCRLPYGTESQSALQVSGPPGI